tara:strand:+ start:4626 stop:5702 length:1077 start_codon:yes stop_codon:yes gene_type:complete
MEKDINAEHQELVQAVIDIDGELPVEEFNMLSDVLMKKKHEYVEAAMNNDNKEKGKIMAWTNMASQSLKQYKNFRQDLASAYNTGALMTGWSETREGQATMNLLRNDQRLVEKICEPGDAHCSNKNELGIMMPDFETMDSADQVLKNLDKEYSSANSEIQNAYAKPYLEERDKLNKTIQFGAYKWSSMNNLKNNILSKDKGTKDTITAMGNNYLTQSTQSNPADNIPFNENAARRQVAASVVGKTNNIKSLCYDEMITGRVFIDDFKEMIKGNTYGDLGINLEGVNAKDGINDEEADIIARDVIENPDHEKLLKEELTNYYVNFLKNQWNTGRRSRPNPVKQNEPSKATPYKPGESLA